MLELKLIRQKLGRKWQLLNISNTTAHYSHDLETRLLILISLADPIVGTIASSVSTGSRLRIRCQQLSSESSIQAPARTSGMCV